MAMEEGIELFAGDNPIAQEHLPERHVDPRCRLTSQGGLELRSRDDPLFQEELTESTGAGRLVMTDLGCIALTEADGAPSIRATAEGADRLWSTVDVAQKGPPVTR